MPWQLSHILPKPTVFTLVSCLSGRSLFKSDTWTPAELESMDPPLTLLLWKIHLLTYFPLCALWHPLTSTHWTEYLMSSQHSTWPWTLPQPNFTLISHRHTWREKKGMFCPLCHIGDKFHSWMIQRTHHFCTDVFMLDVVVCTVNISMFRRRP